MYYRQSLNGAIPVVQNYRELRMWLQSENFTTAIFHSTRPPECDNGGLEILMYAIWKLCSFGFITIRRERNGEGDDSETLFLAEKLHPQVATLLPLHSLA